MRILLDTAALIIAMNDPERLSRKATSAIEGATIREVSAISISEVAIKHGVRKIDIGPAEITRGMDDLLARFLPFTEEHALRLFGLPFHHKDPFDRQIIAQALVEGIPVVTPDHAFKQYRGLSVVW